MTKRLSPEDLTFIEAAARHFASPSLAIRAANLLGRPIQMAVQALPEKGAALVAKATDKALRRALEASLKTMPTEAKDVSFAEALSASKLDKWGHTALSAGTGAVGGFFGLPALPLELPVTTVVMLRGIASTARDFGEDLTQVDARLECINVFALSGANDAKDEGYYTVRLGLQQALASVHEYVARYGAQRLYETALKGDAGVLAKLLAKVAQRFQVVVTEKAALQAVPIVSAASGALINTVFTEHIGQTATYHFGLRALERAHGEAAVRDAFDAAQALAAK